MTQKQVDEFTTDNTREVRLPDGTGRQVRLTPDMWDWKEAIQEVEGLSEQELSAYALEEEELQGFSFDSAYRCVVAHLVNRWQ